jgi:hypothetical protein
MPSRPSTSSIKKTTPTTFEDKDEDYSNISILLLDMVEDQFHRYVPYSPFVFRLLLSNY